MKDPIAFIPVIPGWEITIPPRSEECEFDDGLKAVAGVEYEPGRCVKMAVFSFESIGDTVNAYAQGYEDMLSGGWNLISEQGYNDYASSTWEKQDSGGAMMCAIIFTKGSSGAKVLATNDVGQYHVLDAELWANALAGEMGGDIISRWWIIPVALVGLAVLGGIKNLFRR